MRAAPATSAPTSISTDRPSDHLVDLSDYPVREYIQAMAMELAQMALWDGDPALAQALEATARQARVPNVAEPVRDPAPSRKKAS